MFRFRKAARWLDEKKWLSSVIIPMVVALPPSIIVFCDFNPNIRGWIDKHVVVQSLAILWPVLLIPLSMIWSNLKEPVSVSVSQLSLFLRILAQIVGKKVSRFHGFRTQHLPKKSIESRKIFDSITQPDDQLKEIVQGVWSYFEGTKNDPNVEIKVALAKMGKDHIAKFECFYPSNKGPRCPLKELQRPDSCFSKSKSLGKIIVIDSTDIEGAKSQAERRFVPIKGVLEDEEKSVICFPISEPDEYGSIEFVLSVCASRPMHFKSAEQEAYDLVLEHFAQRILLEVFLRDIKLKAR